ncbi:hypothetical protein L1D19_11850 [Vibrio natriegens]|uniref:hypothetical protein n=1 Tax=Vibrio natriegens TaxID=691 RepID=UPI001EFE04FA|nr:hypothetical protein [Vibrio natriegens]MCG9700810.1 hypothetical protein [Vibrio natriegens]
MTIKDWERTTDTTSEQFFEFMKFVVDNDLTDKALVKLSAEGLGKVRVSVQHIRVIQELIKDELAGSVKGNATIMSAHVDGACK